MENELISIIVPVYHTEAYLRRCLGSLLAQSDPNFEILAVVDGPEENPGDLRILEAVAGYDPRLRVIQQPHGGVSAARNTGVEQAAGSWFLFVDSDDWVSPDLLRVLRRVLQKQDAKLIVFDRYLNYSDPSKKQVRQVFPLPHGRYDTTEALLKLADLSLPTTTHGKLFRADLFRSVRFPVGELWEDAAVLHELIEAAGGLYYINYAGYHYYQRTDSITGSDPDHARKWRFLQFRKRYCFLKERHPEILHSADAGLVTMAILYGIYCVRSGEKAACAEATAWLKQQDLSARSIPVRKRLAYRTMLRHPRLFSLTVRLRYRG